MNKKNNEKLEYTERFTHYWHDHDECMVIVDNETTEEYPIQDNRVKDPKYDKDGIIYLCELLNMQNFEIQQLSIVHECLYEAGERLKQKYAKEDQTSKLKALQDLSRVYKGLAKNRGVTIG